VYDIKRYGNISRQVFVLGAKTERKVERAREGVLSGDLASDLINK